MSTLTYTDEPELLAAIQAKAEWADVPVVRVVSADTESWEGDPTKTVILLVDDKPEQPISLQYEHSDPRWQKLMAACRYASRWIWERDPSRDPMVSFRHTWRSADIYQAA